MASSAPACQLAPHPRLARPQTAAPGWPAPLSRCAPACARRLHVCSSTGSHKQSWRVCSHCLLAEHRERRWEASSALGRFSIPPERGRHCRSLHVPGSLPGFALAGRTRHAPHPGIAHKGVCHLCKAQLSHGVCHQLQGAGRGACCEESADLKQSMRCSAAPAAMPLAANVGHSKRRPRWARSMRARGNW